jgi:hypothetical protein
MLPHPARTPQRPARRKVPTIEVLQPSALLNRLEKHMESPQCVKLDGYQMVIAAPEVEADFVRRTIKYLQS